MTEQMDIIRLKVEGQVRHSDGIELPEKLLKRRGLL